MKNPYKILNCSEQSTKEEIIKSYKKLALKYHPDRNTKLNEKEKKEYEEQFKQITKAYDYLKKNNFKPGIFNDFDDYVKTSTFNSFTKDFLKGGIKIGDFFKNVDMDNIANNILKGVNDMQKMYNLNNEKLEKSQDICINANVELVDIYNNVKKEITIDCIKKCKECHEIGYNINTKAICSKCSGLKIIEDKINLSFECRFKNKRIKGGGNEEIGKRQGDIFINIFPKPNPRFRIIDDYNILYKLVLTNELIKDTTIFFDLEFLDLKTRNVQIHNPLKKFMHEYISKDLGLIHPKGLRGNFIIFLIDPDNLIKYHDSAKSPEVIIK